VAHAFFLGTTYSKKFTALYDKQKLCEMGCYGIGVSRLMQTIIEHSLAVNNGKMIWPVSIAPMSVCITPLGNKKDTQLMSKAMDLYDKLDSRYPGEIVLDDRSQLSIGERVRHIELLGYPIAVVIGLKVS
uniref:Anticodon-binding domain-containing protein n=1 Tax=Amphimedon queenslandica TaxID=400682 RepID=A0A1X7TC39_AMPQE